MYFVSSILSIVSLVAFGVFNYTVTKYVLDPAVATGLKWSSLGAACSLIFAVQVPRRHISRDPANNLVAARYRVTDVH